MKILQLRHDGFGVGEDVVRERAGYVPFEHRTVYGILDAQCVEKGPVCRLKLAMHIPISFHGTFTHNVFTHPEPIVSKL
ncbi:hypothetical protein DIPPA_07211 [Diplonema papillatum]|nr:hypothetical protein DIPPA_07211 [Diplonema papillatum]